MFNNIDYNSLTNYYLEFIEKNQINNLKIDKIEEIYSQLIDLINYHNQQYYIYSTPLISDYQYDKIFSYLKEIEKISPDIVNIDSPTQKLNFQIQTDFKIYEHPYEMLSLENTYNENDITDWHNFIEKQLNKNPKLANEKISFVVEPKFDGISVELIYINSKLEKAITRGDGNVGEDITENIKAVKNVPLKINFENNSNIILSIRGEIVMPKLKLEKINKQRLENGLSLFANTRNATSGSIRQLDPNITAQRGLEFYPYEIQPLIFENNEYLQINNINVNIQDLGFKIIFKGLEFENIENIIKYCTDTKTIEWVENQEIEFDGLVIKLCNNKIRKYIGKTTHHPKRAVAYKFPAKQLTTKLIGVNWNISRAGTLTPVAILEKINIGGVNVSNASLHNYDFIKQKDIKIGDYVWIQRSGQVIPYIFGTILEKRNGTEEDIKIPDKCPICNAEIVKFNQEIFYYCSNINCPAILKEKLIHFVSKDCMDIEGFGEKFIELFVDCGLIKHYADIYKLYEPTKRIQIKSLPLMGEKRVSELLKNIEVSKNKNLRRIINAIGIKHIGKKTSKVIESSILNQIREKENFNCKKLIELLTDYNFLNTIFGIGPQTIESLIKYLNKQENILIIQQLEDNGLKFNNFETKIDNNIQNLLDGIHFSITGKFHISRSKIVNILQSYGATWDEKPLKTTKFILIGSESGNKLSKAKQYEIEIIEGIDKLIEKYSFLEKKLY